LVRVKPGAKDPDYPDFPIGGWSGSIIEMDEGPRGTMCAVLLDQRTLDAVHPIYRKRCARDEVELDVREPTAAALQVPSLGRSCSPA
jgi:hypothetical protein